METRKTEVEKAISTLIACTRRRPKDRPKSITEIAEIIEFLHRELQSYRAVAETVGLSTEMLREFRSVQFVSPIVRTLIEKRIIDSVDLVYRISKLDPQGQEEVVDNFLRDELSGNDARVVKSFKRRSCQATPVAISQVKKSRNVKTYLVKFDMPQHKAKSELQKKFENIVAKSEIVSFRVQDGKAVLELSFRGQKQLRAAAKKKNITLRKLVSSLLERR